MSLVVDKESKQQSKAERTNCMYVYQKVTSPENRYTYRLSTEDGTLFQIIQKKALFDHFWHWFIKRIRAVDSGKINIQEETEFPMAVEVNVLYFLSNWNH